MQTLIIEDDSGEVMARVCLRSHYDIMCLDDLMLVLTADAKTIRPFTDEDNN